MNTKFPPGTRVMLTEQHFLPMGFSSGYLFEYGVRGLFLGCLFDSQELGLVAVDGAGEVILPLSKLKPLIDGNYIGVEVWSTGDKPTPPVSTEKKPDTVCKVGQGFVNKEEIWAAVKAFGDGGQ